jgi:hypothetical protein
MTYQLLIILNPHCLLGIPRAEAHMFQIFVAVAVACDYLWFISNKAHHEGHTLNAIVISSTINKTILNIILL